VLRAEAPGLKDSLSGCGFAGDGDAEVVSAVAATSAAELASAVLVPRAAAALRLDGARKPPQPELPAAVGGPASNAFYARNNVTLHIWTLGLRFVDKLPLASPTRAALVRDAHKSASLHRPVPSGWPAAFLMSGGWATPQDLKVAVDTRSFKDPARGNSGRHLGFHGAVLDGLVHSRCQNFEVFFMDSVWAPILAAVSAAPSHEPRVVHVLSFCKSGRHRSVGIASLIWEVARETTSWELQMDHLSSSEWWQGTCNNCRECKSKHDSRKDVALAAALAAAGMARQVFDSRRPVAPRLRQP